MGLLDEAGWVTWNDCGGDANRWKTGLFAGTHSFEDFPAVWGSGRHGPDHCVRRSLLHSLLGVALWTISFLSLPSPMASFAKIKWIVFALPASQSKKEKLE